MQKYFDSVFGDALGLRPIAGASVTVRMSNGSLASIFSDNGITPKANPVITDSTGYFEFYAADGKYNLTIAATGFATQVRNDVLLEDPAEASPGTFTTLAVSGNSTIGGATTTTTIGGAGVVTNGFTVLTGDTSVQTLSTTGNVGVGGTPHAWGAGIIVLQIGSRSAFFDSGVSTLHSNNGYFDGASFRYISNGFASAYETANGIHRWFSSPSGTVGGAIAFGNAKMTLTQAGNLLVGGTTDSGYCLDAQRSATIGNIARFSDGVSNTLAVTSAASFIHIANTSSNALLLGTSNIERVRITPVGFAKFSNTESYLNGVSSAYHEFRSDSSGEVFVLSSANTASTVVVQYQDLPSAAAGQHSRFLTGGTTVYRVLANGNVQNTNNSYGATSDIKLKENVADATPKLANLNKLRVVNYNLKTDPGFKQIGLIAQEVEQVFPGLVESTPDVDPETKEPTGTVTKAVKYSVLVPMMLKAIQELSAELAELKAAK